MKRLLYIVAIFAVLIFIVACTPTPKDVVKQDELPPIYPDYCDVTIPENIAPLNFLLRADCEAIEVSILPSSREEGLGVEGINKVPNYYAQSSSFRYGRCIV